MLLGFFADFFSIFPLSNSRRSLDFCAQNSCMIFFRLYRDFSKNPLLIKHPTLLCRESKKSDVRPLVTSVCPSVRPCVRPCVRPSVRASVRPVKNESKNIHENRSFEWRDILFGFPKWSKKLHFLRKSPKLGPKKYVSPLKGTILVVKNDTKWLKLRPPKLCLATQRNDFGGQKWTKKPVAPSGPLCSAGVI